MLIPCKEKYLHKNLFHGAPIAIPRILLYSRSPVHPVLWQSRILQFPAPLKSLQDRNTVPLTWAVQAAHCLAKETLHKSRITRCWPRGQILSAEDFIAHRLLFKFLGLISRVWKLSWSSPFVLKKQKKIKANHMESEVPLPRTNSGHQGLFRWVWQAPAPCLLNYPKQKTIPKQ